MRKLFLLFFGVLLLSSFRGMAMDCPWTITLSDSYGDGWNGSTLIIKENGVAIDTLTIPSGYEASYQVDITSGSNVQFFFTTGSYNSECSFAILDNIGDPFYTSQVGLVPGQVYAFSSYCACAANATIDYLDYGTQVYFFASETLNTTDFSISWNFGDGSPLITNDLDPIHTFSAAGQYNVTLIVSLLGDSLCADTSVLPITLDTCTANAMFDFSIVAQTVSFSTFFPYDTTFFDVDWVFGDNLSGSGNPVDHVYASAGFYSVNCIVTSLADTTCFDSFTQIVPVGSCNLSAGFNYFNEGFTANFYPSAPWNSTLLWNFGDGTTSTTQYPTHEYAAVGFYTVSLTVYSSTNPNCYETISQQVYIDGCMANFFNIDYLVEDNTIHLQTILSSGQTGYIINWDLGDGTQILNQDSVTHTYAEPGIYQIVCSIQSATDPNCHTILEQMVPVWGPCIVDGPVGFSFSDDMNLNFVFTADTVFTDPNIIYYWDFGDTYFSSAGYSVEHSFANPGFYDVTLYVGHPYIPGCLDSTTFQVEAFICTADANFNFNVNPVNQMVYYFHSPHNYDFSEFSILWDFGDGATIENNNHPSFQFPYPGLYPVSFEVSHLENGACHSFKGDTLDLCNMNVDFSYTTDFLDFSATTLYDPSQYTIEWDFGDGGTLSGQQSVNHSYALPGTYEVCISITHNLYTSCSFQTCYNVTLTPNGLTDLPWSNGNISLFPNPASTSLNIELNNAGGKAITYQVHTVTGQEVFSGTLSGQGLIKQSLDVSNWNPGVYIIQFEDADGQKASMKFLR